MGTKGRAAKTILAWTAAIAVLSTHYACAQQLESGLFVDLLSVEGASPIALQAPSQVVAQENATPSATQLPRFPDQHTLPVVDPNIDFSQFAVPAPASNPSSDDAQAECRDGTVQQFDATVVPELMQPWWSEQLVLPDNVHGYDFSRHIGSRRKYLDYRQRQPTQRTRMGQQLWNTQAKHARRSGRVFAAVLVQR